jgi:hypothetical protein
MRDVEATLAARSLPPAIADTVRAGIEATALWDAETERLRKQHADLQAAVAARKSEADYERERAAREEREQQIAAAEAALRQAADEYLTTYTALVRDLRSAADGIGRALAQMRVVGQLGSALSKDGRVPAACSGVQLETDLALLISAAFRGVPGHRNRLSHLVWLSGADMHFPAGGDWAQRERLRVERQIVEPLVKVEG